MPAGAGALRWWWSIPARDEVGSRSGAACARSWRRIIPADYRIVLVDDGSQDGTGEAASGFTDPRLTDDSRVPNGKVGWSGKLWALQPGHRAPPEPPTTCC